MRWMVLPHERIKQTQESILQLMVVQDRGENLEFTPRYLHRATQIGEDGTGVLVFGGQGYRDSFYNDSHFLDLDEKRNPSRTMKKLKVKSRTYTGQMPYPRCSGSVQAVQVFNSKTKKPGRQVCAFFGGSRGFFEAFSNSLLVLQTNLPSEGLFTAVTKGSGLSWVDPVVKNPLPPNVASFFPNGDGVPISDARIPGVRWGHATCVWNGRMIVFAGSNTNQCFNDLWMLTLEDNDDSQADPDQITATWTKICPINQQQRASIPPPRAGVTISLCNECLYTFGGCRVSNTYNDVWKMDLTKYPDVKWERIYISGVTPSARVGHAAIVMGDRIIIGGGRGIRGGDPSRPAKGKFSSHGLAAMQGLTFFESGFSILDTTSNRWLEKQFPLKEEGKEEDE